MLTCLDGETDAAGTPELDEKMLRFTPHLLAAVAALAVPAALEAAGSGSMDSMMQSSADEDYRKAVKAVEAEQYRTAVGLLNKVVKEKPRHPDALNYLGYSHRKLGDYALAVSYYKRALSLDRDHRGANEYLGEAYVKLGNLAGAEERLSELARICGTRCEEYKNLREAIEAARARNARQG